MRSAFPPASTKAASVRASAAFTLVELLVVVGVLSMIVTLAIPALRGLKGSGDFNRGIDQVASALGRARTHAMARNTYVWVGFHERSASGNGATADEPPFDGVGKVVLGIVASRDGTRIFEDGATPMAIPGDRIVGVEKPIVLENLHLADVDTHSNQLTDRPAADLHIRSDSPDRTPFPIPMGGYTFYKTIRFSPSGEATVNDVENLSRLTEIGLVQTQGDHVPDSGGSVAAIQLTGVGGNIRIHRP